MESVTRSLFPSPRPRGRPRARLVRRRPGTRHGLDGRSRLGWILPRRSRWRSTQVSSGRFLGVPPRAFGSRFPRAVASGGSGHQLRALRLPRRSPPSRRPEIVALLSAVDPSGEEPPPSRPPACWRSAGRRGATRSRLPARLETFGLQRSGHGVARSAIRWEHRLRRHRPGSWREPTTIEAVRRFASIPTAASPGRGSFRGPAEASARLAADAASARRRAVSIDDRGKATPSFSAGLWRADSPGLGEHFAGLLSHARGVCLSGGGCRAGLTPNHGSWPLSSAA
jgi:hypothetical protein